MTAYYIVEDPDEFFADDFGNDDAPAPHLLAAQTDWDFAEDPDEFFADDFGNDDAPPEKKPSAPNGLKATLH